MSAILQRVTPAIRAKLDASENALRRRDRDVALRLAREAASLAPDHPETLRQVAAALSTFGPSGEALALIDRAIALRPDDVQLLTTRAVVLEGNGNKAAAIDAFRQAHAIAPTSISSTYNLGRVLSKYGASDESLVVLDRALAMDPNHRGARATKAEVLRHLGRTEEAIAEHRYLISRDPHDINVWSALAALDWKKFTEAEIATLEGLERNASLPVEPRVRLGFALGKIYEDRARYADAYGVYLRANTMARSQLPWIAAAFSGQVTSISNAFAEPIRNDDTQLGAGTIFIVSLPRSGSTLTEQILAAHPLVDAGDERMDVFDVIAAEGQRRKLPLARWAPLATHEDWHRLGHDYLERAAKWRGDRPFATDKMPANWLWLGAALAMLPGARVVECRRDILETAWSCFCHLFARGAQEFSYDFESIAAYARDYDRTMSQWKSIYPSRIRTQVYEAMVSDTETQTRELLAFCGLDFDPACLRFYEAQRSVRTASASQVREPMRKDTARTAKYGALLDPLRTALGLPLFTD
ncbi:MAG: sulfotransferase [Rudaea sp.]